MFPFDDVVMETKTNINLSKHGDSYLRQWVITGAGNTCMVPGHYLTKFGYVSCNSEEKVQRNSQQNLKMLCPWRLIPKDIGRFVKSLIC